MDSTKQRQGPPSMQQAQRHLRRATELLGEGELEAAQEEADRAIREMDLLTLRSGPTSPESDPSPTSARAAGP